MKTLKFFFVLALTMLVSISVDAAKPKIRIIATGGTIAGAGTSATSSAYGAGKIGVEALIDAVPQIKDLADVSGEQLVNIGSQDMNDQVWLQLAKRINALLNKEGYDGVLITHGTDTMEETAYFLSLTVKSDKPVVLVGSMRPATGISADGPANLYNGIATLVDPASKGHGVMVCMNNQLFDAKTVIKTHTTDLATFEGTYGQIGYVYNSKPYFVFEPLYRHTLNSEFCVENLNELPKVDIVYGYANASAAPFKAVVADGCKGIVLAGVGDGNFYKDMWDVATGAQKSGIQIVRASRCPLGPTCENGEVDDAANHFVAAINHNPQKARVLLTLALTKYNANDWQKIQQLFYEY